MEDSLRQEITVTIAHKLSDLSKDEKNKTRAAYFANNTKNIPQVLKQLV